MENTISKKSLTIRHSPGIKCFVDFGCFIKELHTSFCKIGKTQLKLTGHYHHHQQQEQQKQQEK